MADLTKRQKIRLSDDLWFSVSAGVTVCLVVFTGLGLGGFLKDREPVRAGVIFGTMTLPVLGFAIWRYLLIRRLERHGVIVTGRARNLVREYEGMGDLEYAYTFEGRTHEVIRSFPMTRVGRLRSGAPLKILVDPRSPDRHVVLFN